MEVWQKPLESVYPTKAKYDDMGISACAYGMRAAIKPKSTFAKPRVFIPVFPGTNCEYDSARAFERAGGVADIRIFRNLKAADIDASVNDFADAIKKSQIIMFPGGFSGGDEPDGSGKFIATAFRNPKIAAAVTELLEERDGLILGICNGFQALIKLGLVPFGKITETDDTCPTLTFNTIGRHVSQIVTTRVASVKSPWLAHAEVDELYNVAVSHGEGRFVASAAMLAELEANGQIATQYTDPDGNPTYEMPYNPNGSYNAIEGITSPDGRIFGKMGHSERNGENIYKNVIGKNELGIFKSGVDYFKI